MELRIMRYFLAVAKEQSITRATEVLHVTQPTLSRQLTELEEEMGTQLFVRGKRKITLTEKGILFRQRAEEIVSLAEKTEQEVKAKDSFSGGDIYIGCAESDSMRFLAKVAKDLQQNYQNLRYHLASGNAADVRLRLEKGLLDFGVLMDPFDKRDYNYLELPGKDVWGILMRKDSLLTSHEHFTRAEVSKLPLLVSEQEIAEGNHSGLSGWLHKNFEDLNIVATYNLLYNASLLVQEGMGYALTIDKLANTGPNSPLCFKPLSPRLEAKTYFVWRKYQVFSTAAKLFLEYMRKKYGENV
jgi:DNA-binding transcriptional LysR family regulator